MLQKKIINNENRRIYRYYSKPSFISGIASLFDLYNAKPSQEIYLSNSEDFKAIAEDFKVTGLNLKLSVERYFLKNNVPKK